MVQGIGQCEELAAGVLQGPLAIEREFPFHPHVTIAHHLHESRLEQAFVELERFEAAFDVDEMWMYLHDAVSGLAADEGVRLRVRRDARAAQPDGVNIRTS